MKLSELKSTKGYISKRLGRGYGSSKGGHTSSRGQKGQKSRNSVPIWFEGGQLPSIRRFPFIRGKGRFSSLKPATVGINLDQLSKYKANDKVNLKSLASFGLVKSRQLETAHIKILGRGEITIPLIIEVSTSAQARKKIEAAGGKVESGQNI